MFDDDLGAEAEAIATARHDADLEQAELDAAGDALYAACDAMGICLHGLVDDHRNRPELAEGYQRCRFCKKAESWQWFRDDRNASYTRLEEAGVL
ncbi:hypothetical protein [Nonomuraea basaltis]|uniref:hypothetical protein n=1 Tax=Nonomuraea basaltis TaxID=2495887 RepID=UPI00110C59EF|nr:hypothetical protein [Nonomuraea basaltis]TMR99588.1 hypothetical protein EJK15_07175 [Nonomuraea basaltis]